MNAALMNHSRAFAGDRIYIKNSTEHMTSKYYVPMTDARHFSTDVLINTGFKKLELLR